MSIRRPNEIKEEIKRLEKKLEQSKNRYQYSFICDNKWSDEMIGFFNIGNAKKILSLLHEGKELQYRHAIYGIVNVYMNPQRNRILVSNNNHINEGNILSFIVRYTGEWYLKNDEI